MGSIIFTTLLSTLVGVLFSLVMGSSLQVVITTTDEWGPHSLQWAHCVAVGTSATSCTSYTTTNSIFTISYSIITTISYSITITIIINSRVINSTIISSTIIYSTISSFTTNINIITNNIGVNNYIINSMINTTDINYTGVNINNNDNTIINNNVGVNINITDIIINIITNLRQIKIDPALKIEMFLQRRNCFESLVS